MCMCVCTSLNVSMCRCMNVHAHVCVYMCMSVHACTCPCLHVYTLSHTCKCMHVCVYVHECSCMCTHVAIRACGCMSVHVPIRASACMSVFARARAWLCACVCARAHPCPAAAPRWVSRKQIRLSRARAGPGGQRQPPSLARALPIPARGSRPPALPPTRHDTHRPTAPAPGPGAGAAMGRCDCWADFLVGAGPGHAPPLGSSPCRRVQKTTGSRGGSGL